jgi:probable F420-dependent oxidoreductase
MTTLLRPFRFSIVAATAQSYQEVVAKARKAEDLGYTTFLAADHLGYSIDPVVTLMAVASVTSLRIGSHVFCNDFRHPVVLAREAANLDLLSEGRFQFGLGCGYLATEYAQAGIPLDPTGVRISRFEEALQLIKAYFQEEQQVTFTGKYYQVTKLPTAIKTVQKPCPPIYIGGGGKRVLSFAAREANIVGLTARNNARGLDWTSALPEANYEKVSWIREAAGERFGQIELSSTVFITAVTDHTEGAAHGIGQRLGLTAEQTRNCSHVLVGSVEQIVEELQKRRELFGVSCIEIQEANIDAFAPVVARLAGK